MTATWRRMSATRRPGRSRTRCAEVRPTRLYQTEVRGCSGEGAAYRSPRVGQGHPRRAPRAAARYRAHRSRRLATRRGVRPDPARPAGERHHAARRPGAGRGDPEPDLAKGGCCSSGQRVCAGRLPALAGSAVEARKLAERVDASPDAVVYLDAPHDVLMRRILARAAVEGRSDDYRKTVRNRLRVFDEATEPLVEYYRDRGLLHVIDAAQDEHAVTAAILQAA